ncbi:hypothetical protein [Ornithinibacillus scapharcae]|uniref:hypothetical protein n=1 Tax=Ornithinibacillus scapharcae TaxID=1147159 RepID=UPI000225BD63|nr:hypothetical protein [Ornithinibacillus scapharcae]
MSKLKKWVLILFSGMLIILLLWWLLPEKQEEEAVYLYRERGHLTWLELTSQHDKVNGKLYQKKVVEEVGQVPYMEENEFTLAGEETEAGYTFTLKQDKKTIEVKANLVDSKLSLDIPGEEGSKQLRLVTIEELTEQQEAIQADLDDALYHMEKKEKDRIAKFVSDFTSVYGYLYAEDNKPYQLFLRIDEALLQGEVTAELLLMERTEDENQPYKETRYPMNGISDGLILKLYTDVDGVSTLLEGRFHDSVESFDLSFWLTDEKLLFREVTEEEFNQKYDEFKTNAMNQ